MQAILLLCAGYYLYGPRLFYPNMQKKAPTWVDVTQYAAISLLGGIGMLLHIFDVLSLSQQ